MHVAKMEGIMKKKKKKDKTHPNFQCIALFMSQNVITIFYLSSIWLFKVVFFSSGYFIRSKYIVKIDSML